jgi:hypothetical protein
MKTNNLTNDIIGTIFGNINGKDLKGSNLNIHNTLILTHYLKVINNQASLKIYMSNEFDDKFICALNGYDILTQRHIMNRRQKVKLNITYDTFLMTAYYLGHYKIAFQFINNEVKIYSYDKDTLTLSLLNKLQSIDLFFILKNKKIILTNFLGELTMLKRHTYNKQVESNIIANKVKQIVEVTNDRFITFNLDNKVRLWCSETLNLIKVFTDFNGKEFSLLNFMYGLKNGLICAKYFHFGNRGNFIVHGIWDVDTPKECKQLFINKTMDNYSFRETKNYIILIKLVKYRDLKIEKITEVLLFSFEGYKLVKKLSIVETFSEIYAIEDKLVLLQDGVSVRLYDETFELIDEVEMVAEKITCVDKKKFLISIDTGKMNIILKLNK